jgi:hypothetical protein
VKHKSHRLHGLARSLRASCICSIQLERTAHE